MAGTTACMLCSMLSKWAATKNDTLYVGCIYGLCFVNAFVAHGLIGVLQQAYNPGLFQSIVLMIPISAYVLRLVHQQHGMKILICCLLFGSVWGHGICLLLPMKLWSLGYINEYLFTDLEVQRVLKRYGKYVNWEPLFFGTTMDPWYDYRMTWEGRKDKKIQVNGTILSFFLALQVSILEAFRTLSHGLRIPRSQQRFPCQTTENQVPGG